MIIRVSVKPGSKEEKVEKISNEEYNIWIKERAEKGKANAALTKLLSKEFGVKQKQINIKNPTSRKKIIEIIE